MRKKILITLFVVYILVTIFYLIYLKNGINNSKYDKQCSIVKDYFDSEYNTDSKVEFLDLVYNDEGFTAGLYQYYFSVLDTKTNIKYKAIYKNYFDITEDTIKYIKFKEN